MPRFVVSKERVVDAVLAHPLAQAVHAEADIDTVGVDSAEPAAGIVAVFAVELVLDVARRIVADVVRRAAADTGEPVAASRVAVGGLGGRWSGRCGCRWQIAAKACANMVSPCSIFDACSVPLVDSSLSRYFYTVYQSSMSRPHLCTI